MNLLGGCEYKIYNMTLIMIIVITIKGYKRRNAYAITQMPLANTVQDFWCLVLEQDVSTIVMMNSFKKDKVHVLSKVVCKIV